MKYKISKTAIIGPAYYLASLLFILPYSFNKYNPGLKFKFSSVRAVLAIFAWMGIIMFIFARKPPQMLLLLLFPFIISSIFFFPLVYSRHAVIQCLNTAYSLLQQTQHSPSIIVPMMLIFVPLFSICFLIPAAHFFTENPKFAVYTVVDVFVFAMMSVINSLCFSVSLILKDIKQQLKSQHKHLTPGSLVTLARFQWQAYQLSRHISQAFGPFLVIYILYNSLLTLNVFLTIMTYKFPAYSSLIYNSCCMVILCFSSHHMNSQSAKITDTIQKLMSNSAITRNDYKKLALMMEQARLGSLCISVLGSFQLDLPIILTLSNAIVTYVMILLEIL